MSQRGGKPPTGSASQPVPSFNLPQHAAIPAIPFPATAETLAQQLNPPAPVPPMVVPGGGKGGKSGKGGKGGKGPLVPMQTTTRRSSTSAKINIEKAQRKAQELQREQANVGHSCHQCKNSKKLGELLFCMNPSPDPITLRQCRKKFCLTCLHRSYNEDISHSMVTDASFDPNIWSCPACRLLCNCASCRRVIRSKANKKGRLETKRKAGNKDDDEEDDEPASIDELEKQFLKNSKMNKKSYLNDHLFTLFNREPILHCVDEEADDEEDTTMTITSTPSILATETIAKPTTRATRSMRNKDISGKGASDVFNDHDNTSITAQKRKFEPVCTDSYDYGAADTIMGTMDHIDIHHHQTQAQQQQQPQPQQPHYPQPQYVALQQHSFNKMGDFTPNMAAINSTSAKTTTTTSTSTSSIPSTLYQHGAHQNSMSSFFVHNTLNPPNCALIQPMTMYTTPQLTQPQQQQQSQSQLHLQQPQHQQQQQQQQQPQHQQQQQQQHQQQQQPSPPSQQPQQQLPHPQQLQHLCYTQNQPQPHQPHQSFPQQSHPQTHPQYTPNTAKKPRYNNAVDFSSLQQSDNPLLQYKQLQQHNIQQRSNLSQFQQLVALQQSANPRACLPATTVIPSQLAPASLHVANPTLPNHHMTSPTFLAHSTSGHHPINKTPLLNPLSTAPMLAPQNYGALGYLPGGPSLTPKMLGHTTSHTHKFSPLHTHHQAPQNGGIIGPCGGQQPPACAINNAPRGHLGHRITTSSIVPTIIPKTTTTALLKTSQPLSSSNMVNPITHPGILGIGGLHGGPFTSNTTHITTKTASSFPKPYLHPATPAVAPEQPRLITATTTTTTAAQSAAIALHVQETAAAALPPPVVPTVETENLPQGIELPQLSQNSGIETLKSTVLTTQPSGLLVPQPHRSMTILDRLKLRANNPHQPRESDDSNAIKLAQTDDLGVELSWLLPTAVTLSSFQQQQRLHTQQFNQLLQLHQKGDEMKISIQENQSNGSNTNQLDNSVEKQQITDFASSWKIHQDHGSNSLNIASEPLDFGEILDSKQFNSMLHDPHQRCPYGGVNAFRAGCHSNQRGVTVISTLKADHASVTDAHVHLPNTHANEGTTDSDQSDDGAGMSIIIPPLFAPYASVPTATSLGGLNLFRQTQRWEEAQFKQIKYHHGKCDNDDDNDQNDNNMKNYTPPFVAYINNAASAVPPTMVIPSQENQSAPTQTTVLQSDQSTQAPLITTTSRTLLPKVKLIGLDDFV